MRNVTTPQISKMNIKGGQNPDEDNAYQNDDNENCVSMNRRIGYGLHILESCYGRCIIGLEFQNVS